MSWFSALAGAGGATVNLISGYSLDFLNRYVDVSFDPNAYHSTGGGVQASDLTIVFSQNGGTATGLSIASVTNTSGGALVGGENTIRVNLTLTGSASGVEYFEVKPSAASTIKDSSNRFISGSDSTGTITLSITYDADYITWLLYLESNSIGIPTVTQRNYDNTLILGFKSTGAWSEFDKILLLANNIDRDTALIDLKTPGTNNATISGTPTWTDEIGVLSDGSGYINTKFIPATHGSKFLRDDASFWIYVKDDGAGAYSHGGAGESVLGASGGRIRVLPRNNSNQLRYALNSNSGGKLIANTTANALWIISREASNSVKAYKDGTLFDSDTASSSLRSDQEMYVCAENNNGAAASFDTIHRIGFVAFGSGMQDIISSVSALILSWIDSTDSPPADTGRLYMLGGQSNMSGQGLVSELPGYLTGPIDRCYIWVNTEWQIIEAGVNINTNSAYFGPILSLAYEESQKHLSDNLFFVLNGTGGSNLENNWDPSTGNQYASMISKYNNAVAALNVSSYEAFIWFQGEADAKILAYANAYEANESAMISDVFAVTEFTKAIVCNINSDIDVGAYYTTVRTAKANNLSGGNYGVGGALIETNDLTHDGDNVHLDSDGCIAVGERISAAI